VDIDKQLGVIPHRGPGYHWLTEEAYAIQSVSFRTGVKEMLARFALGLLPSASASGERRRQGASTTVGHTHARRALVEGAWADRYPATVSRHVPLRLEQLPKPSQDISWKAHVRLCQRFRRLMARGKHANQVVVAMARELAGFIWAMAQQVRVTPSGHQTTPSGPITQEGSPRQSAEAQPRGGATLDGVTRPTGALVPRVRQAPDGG
jgi:Transposase IS116/IS110/IS902 family